MYSKEHWVPRMVEGIIENKDSVIKSVGKFWCRQHFISFFTVRLIAFNGMSVVWFSRRNYTVCRVSKLWGSRSPLCWDIFYTGWPFLFYTYCPYIIALGIYFHTPECTSLESKFYGHPTLTETHFGNPFLLSSLYGENKFLYSFISAFRFLLCWNIFHYLGIKLRCLVLYRWA